MKNKSKYSVYSRYVMTADEIENCTAHPWEYVGDTYAVSEKQAINNVRHRTIGDLSQYKPIATSGHWDSFLEWKAELNTRRN